MWGNIEEPGQQMQQMELFNPEKSEPWEVGMDEAGRGCLAGPVVVAGLAWQREWAREQPFFSGLDDSKKLNLLQRETAFKQLIACHLPIQVTVLNPFWIDRFNILQATLLGFEHSYPLQRNVPTYIDGNQRPASMKWARTEVGGDSRIPVIMAASIVAKVVRDRLLDSWSRAWPDYSFAKNKGYGTAAHLEALAKVGPCPIHRKTFRPVRDKLTVSWPDGPDYLMAMPNPGEAFLLYMRRYHEISLERDPDLFRYFSAAGLWNLQHQGSFPFHPLAVEDPSGISLAFSPPTSGESP